MKHVLFICSQNRLRSPIPDEFEFMDPALVRLLEAKAGPFFQRG